MKKIFILSFVLFTGAATFGQSFSNAGMEMWRNNNTGSPAVAVHAPSQWYGFDSLAISLIEMYGSIIFGHPITNLHAQLYQESTIIHSGIFSAKVMTIKQDTLGVIPGSLSNAVASVSPAIVLATHSLAGATSFSGGTLVNERVTSVSAWVEYLPGVDSLGNPTTDTGSLTVQTLGHVRGGRDTVIGNGILQIVPSASFTQITAPVVYTVDTSLYTVDTVRVIFSSSGGGRSRPADSSTLYVDDVTMTGTPDPDYTGVGNVTMTNSVKVYPNPAKGTLYVETQSTNTIALYSVTGEIVATKMVTGHDMMDVSKLPAGMYAYVVYDAAGNFVQNGKVVLEK